MKRTLRKLVTMGFAALCAFAGVMADDGSDPGVLSPGEWTTDLTVNGRKVWSKYSVPKGEGWGCRYDSKQNLLTLNISSGGSYTIGGELTGRSMDKKGKVTKINFGRVAIAQSCTVTLDSFSATACTGFSTVEIADGKEDDETKTLHGVVDFVALDPVE